MEDYHYGIQMIIFGWFDGVRMILIFIEMFFKWKKKTPFPHSSKLNRKKSNKLLKVNIKIVNNMLDFKIIYFTK